MFFTYLLISTIWICSFCSDYKVVSSTTNSTHIVLSLEYTGSQQYYIKTSSPIFKNLTFTLSCLSYSDLSFTITDANDSRFKIPTYSPFPIDPQSKSTFPLNLSLFNVTYNLNPFQFKITRKPTNDVLFDTTGRNIIFSEHYIQIGTKVSSKNVWGFGERFSNRFRLQKGKYTIFNRDRPSTVDFQAGHQSYGSFPIYLMRQNLSQSSTYHINYFRNSNAMDIIIEQTQSAYSFTYKSIGGIIDFRLFLENSPSGAVQKFHSFLGRSAVPPFWSMGFHQSRWGYVNISMIEAVIKGYKDNGIPLDTLWSDIDYMHQCEDFTIDEASFNLKRLEAITNEFKYVPIIDAGIKVNNGTAFTQGKLKQLFVKDAVGEDFHGLVWPGKTVYVDFFHPEAKDYWKRMLQILYQKVKFSGIWLDMNQVSNFCNGPCSFPHHTGFDYSSDIPYQPGAQNDTIEMQTISLNCTHYGNISQANVHIYTGFLQNVATYEFLQSKNMRPFILSRSSVPGTGSYAFHWTGDNAAEFDFLRNSIHQNFLFQIWGIQMVGADICGFVQNTTVQLCSRWFQLGAFYPFSRNHNAFMPISQQPYSLGPTVLEASKVNLKLRYSLLKSYYRLFINNRGMGAIFQPLFFSFPNDLKVLQNDISQTQFMIGEELMFAPIVTNGTTTRQVYLPSGFYDYHTGLYYQSNQSVTIENQLIDPVPAFIRQGYGVYIQDTTNITKVSQLNNQFQFKGGFIQTRSTQTFNEFICTGSILSIQNYDDQSKISLCLRQGCSYNTTWTLYEYFNGTLSLEVESEYIGSNSLNQLQVVKKVHLFYRKNKFVNQIVPTIKITKTQKQTFILRQNAVPIQQMEE